MKVNYTQEQTAVDWYKNELNRIELTYLNKVIDRKVYMDLKSEAFKQALEMQDKQMQLTWNNAIDAVQKDKWESYDDFYNNNFKSE